MLKQYQEVILNVDSYIDVSLDDEPVELKRGQRGVIVEKSIIPGLPVGYHVEFFDDDGETIALPALEEKFLAPAPKHKIGRLKFKLHQEVMLNVDSYLYKFMDEPPVELKRGQRGIILEIQTMPDSPVRYNVGFHGDQGEIIALTALEEEYLAPVLDRRAPKRHTAK